MLIMFVCRNFNSTWGENSMQQFLEEIGASRVILALSAARMGDAVGNSILFIVIPLYVAKLPVPWCPLPETVRAGLLIALYGFVNALIQPFVGALINRTNGRKIFIQSGLVLMGLGTFAYIIARLHRRPPAADTSEDRVCRDHSRINCHNGPFYRKGKTGGRISGSMQHLTHARFDCRATAPCGNATFFAGTAL
jgi:hypothetical protein